MRRLELAAASVCGTLRAFKVPQVNAQAVFSSELVKSEIDVTTCTTHRIQVRYSSPVAQCVRRLRVLPLNTDGEEILSERWQCDPPPDSMCETRDEFGNRVLELRHNRIARDFRFELAIETQRNPILIAREIGLPPQGLGAFLLPSSRSDSTPLIRQLSENDNRADSPEPRAAKLCAVVHGALRYDGAETHSDNTASRALQHGAGVCGDFANLLVSMCRARGLAARYVAGYSIGEGRMHAWVEVLCGEIWLAFDPTHNRRAEGYIIVARGRDSGDVPTIAGTFRGAATARLRVYCASEIHQAHLVQEDSSRSEDRD